MKRKEREESRDESVSSARCAVQYAFLNRRSFMAYALSLIFFLLVFFHLDLKGLAIFRYRRVNDTPERKIYLSKRTRMHLRIAFTRSHVHSSRCTSRFTARNGRREELCEMDARVWYEIDRKRNKKRGYIHIYIRNSFEISSDRSYIRHATHTFVPYPIN